MEKYLTMVLSAWPKPIPTACHQNYNSSGLYPPVSVTLARYVLRGKLTFRITSLFTTIKLKVSSTQPENKTKAGKAHMFTIMKSMFN